MTKFLGLLKLLQSLQRLLCTTASCPLKVLLMLAEFLRRIWKSQRKKKLDMEQSSGAQDLVVRHAWRRSLQGELPSAEASPTPLGQQMAPSSVSQHSGSSQCTFIQNGAANHVPPPNNDSQIAPSLDSGFDSDTAEGQLNHLGNTINFPHPPHRECVQTGKSAPSDDLHGVRVTFPVPEPAASTSSSLRVNWGPGLGAPIRPSERIPRQIIPVAAQSVMRYNRKVRIRSSDSKYTINPGTKEFIDPQRRNIGDWEPCVHPEGALYFRHPHKRICTDANLYKHRNLDVITRCADQLFDWIKTGELQFSEKSELVLELMDDKRANIWRCGYYFVDHAYRCLFWVHPFQAEPIFGNVKGIKSPSHIKYAMEAQYWMHCELFPTQTISLPLWEEIKLTLLHATAETITSDTSLAPFDREELGKMLELTKDLEGSVGARHPHAMCVLARFARMFARTKFFNFCGQVGARLDTDQTVYYNRRQSRSIFLAWISPLLFGAPEIHAKGLKTIWVDRLVNHISWKRFINKLNSEWQEFTLYGTVVLNANVAFLAIQNIKSTTKTLSYVSTVCSVGTVILGLLLARQHRTRGRDSAEEAVYFMTRMTYSMFGTETLAVLYSTPFGLLMWGMIFFVLAFCFQVFEGSNETIQASVGSAVALVGLLVFWTIWASWDSYLPHYWLYILRIFNARRRRKSKLDESLSSSSTAEDGNEDDSEEDQ
ncbi:hypothetical protein PAXRUDRAFT_31630 [Paxillus rubicundulus Ve08.2h10]|uniref:Unplaced genomic scaffold scaffold_101, whole genome shotgun sequence n=1 Tax=Paxillus rubicundulus Ve08.2h10 TaxID=930991 RepID=A0A0D0DU58_9AGAM|nr:hypothetical protein PAXRUDRAFT_31630 [Paxillus rubicundulus Ve08.2h10]